ncbi:MAG: hypothetical protein V4674_02985 [Patescibacteria group bacterium]
MRYSFNLLIGLAAFCMITRLVGVPLGWFAGLMLYVGKIIFLISFLFIKAPIARKIFLVPVIFILWETLIIFPLSHALGEYFAPWGIFYVISLYFFSAVAVFTMWALPALFLVGVIVELQHRRAKLM